LRKAEDKREYEADEKGEIIQYEVEEVYMTESSYIERRAKLKGKIWSVRMCKLDLYKDVVEE
jgi:hypothetical protein